MMDTMRRMAGLPSRRDFFRLAALGGVTRPLLRSAGSHLFEEVSALASGVTWVHDNAMSEQRYLPETIGPGCAFLDYDGDGWLDLYLVNSGPCDFYKPSVLPRNALYKNNRDGTFTDVTQEAGVPGGTFGMGVAVGDYDNDGHPDLFVTSYGRCTLYHNNGDGTFADVTDEAGVGAPGWTTSAVWFDYNNDGLLDLFVCSFVKFGLDKRVFCRDNELGKPYYCIPRLFEPTPSLLFRNNGDGTFSEVSGGTEIARAMGKALGVVASDVNNDGRLDLFVANDTVQNFLFMNRGADVWEEIALLAGVGLSDDGKARSGMGVDAADIDGDGWQDLFVSNVDQETFSLYRNNSGESFSDIAYRQGVAQATRLLSGWGVSFFDFDNDGTTDLLLVNGHPDDMVDRYVPNVSYKEPMLLFRQEGGQLKNVSAEAGPAFQKPRASRGLAIGDYDNDGRLDILVANNGEPPTLLWNRAGEGAHWVGLKLQGVKCNRDAIGAIIRWSAAGQVRSRFKKGGGSYLSSSDPREVLGLGPSERLDWVEVQWPAPSTRVERYAGVPIDKYSTIVEGEGDAC